MPQTKTRNPLSINPTPFKSSHLSIPPSPCSPRTPLTPFLTLSKTTASRRPQSTGVYLPQSASDAPSPPLSWVWQCHQCHRSYHLGVTRRCLEDGHQFCSGTTAVKSWRKPVQQRRTRRNKACASEFDYQGWKSWGRWRRSGARTQMSDTLSKGRVNVQPELKKDCWNICDYPSECRWGKKFGIHTPTPNISTFFELEICSLPVTPEDAPKSPEEGVLKIENVEAVGLEQDKADFWGALIASAKRRKSSAGISPLAVVTEEAEEKDEDDDVIMSSPSSSSESSPSTSPTDTPASVGSAAMEMLKDLMQRKTSRRDKKSTARASNREHNYTLQIPTLTVPKPVLNVKGEEQVVMNDLEGFEPLERVKSRKDLNLMGTVGGF